MLIVSSNKALKEAQDIITGNSASRALSKDAEKVFHVFYGEAFIGKVPTFNAGMELMQKDFLERAKQPSMSMESVYPENYDMWTHGTKDIGKKITLDIKPYTIVEAGEQVIDMESDVYSIE